VPGRSKYAGLTLSDAPVTSPYLALGRGVSRTSRWRGSHGVTGPPGISDDECLVFFFSQLVRVSLGNPALVEEALNRPSQAPRVPGCTQAGPTCKRRSRSCSSTRRVERGPWGASDWSAPARPSSYAYLHALVRGIPASARQLMCRGPTTMYWPQGIGLAVEGNRSRAHLPDPCAEARTLFYGNAKLRFIRQDPATGTMH
jgi:hypothetical protein